jgi:sugar phosphate isomerase/epimerase
MNLSIQLWTVRDHMNADPLGTLQALADMGYQYVETAGLANMDAASYRKVLDDCGLKASGMHVGLNQAEEGFSELMADAKAIGAPYVVVPWVPADTYADGWEVLGRRLEEVGKKVAEEGLGFAYHNHTFEFERTNGVTGFDLMFQAASPTFVKAEIDTFWAHCGGEDPAELILRHKNRTPLVHLKDGRECDAPTQFEAGEGVLNWDSILSACREANVEFGVVELDNCPRDPLESAKMCIDYFRARLG